MAHDFDFNAPKYHDFNSILDDKEVDNFFDTDHEVTQPSSKIEKGQISPPVLKQEVITPEPQNYIELNAGSHPLPDDNSDLSQNSTPRVVRQAHRRVSANIRIATVLPVNKEDVLNQAMESLLVKPEKKRRTLFEGILMSVPFEKYHKMTTRHDQISKTPLLDLRSRSVVRNRAETDDNKRRGSPTVNGNQSKYVCMAERIMHFERDTPPRFHSRRKSDNFQKHQSLMHRLTIAWTPNLMALHRNRPVNAPSQKEKEEMELEEMKRSKVKALPLNQNIFKKPSIPINIEPKPSTVPHPFNLTKATKKPLAEEKLFQFTARPVPKAVLQTPDIKPLRERVIRVPVLEHEDKSYVLKHKEVALQGIQTHRNTKRYTEPQPFSFEERDKQMLKKKENKIKEYLEERKRAREFHANPLPSYVCTTSKQDVSTILPTVPDPPKFRTEERIQLRHVKDSIKSAEEDFKTFKAQPATVLYKKPFEPMKPERPPTCITEIELHTERRAKEREAFDLTVKEREQLLESLRRERETELKKQEEEEVMRLRKEAIHKANPVPSFKTPVIKKSDKPLTEPYSPFFTKRCKNTDNVKKS